MPILRSEVNQSVLIDIDALRVGMFIQLEVGWMNHPFPTSSFRISTHEQIRVLRDLGLKSVRHIPAKSAALVQTPSEAPERMAGVQPDDAGEPAAERPGRDAMTDADVRAMYNATRQRCNQRYQEAATVYEAVCTGVQTAPQKMREQAESLIHTCVAQLLEQGPCAVHLLAGNLGQRSAAHAVNVLVLALLLGRSLRMEAEALCFLGTSALLHDLGKVLLPIHIAEPGAALNPSDMQRYQEHVGLSVDLGQRMGLSSDVLIAIAQHHEMADGSGFPLRLVGEDLSRCGQILALVNRYDRLCNPLHGEQALTPHEALARLFALRRECFDATVLGAFIRMMGVYPPGSLVQLEDGRFGLVVVVDALHSLRPCVVLYEPAVPRDEAPLLNLAQTDGFGILRSLKPAQLPRDALDYLLPQPRISYFFERALSPQDCGGSA
jgi:HD-GYP domain-containing protein (c-di-GMP phosphodiesterase class II)